MLNETIQTLKEIKHADIFDVELRFSFERRKKTLLWRTQWAFASILKFLLKNDQTKYILKQVNTEKQLELLPKILARSSRVQKFR